jgi:hypothetical protein
MPAIAALATLALPAHALADGRADRAGSGQRKRHGGRAEGTGAGPVRFHGDAARGDRNRVRGERMRRCAGQRAAGGMFLLGSARGGRWSGYASSGPWRTRCPGPLVGGENQLLRIAARTRSARARTFTIDLRPAGRREDDGYPISLHGRLALKLRGGRIIQRVFSEPAA